DEARGELARVVRHQLLTVAGFVAINCFYFFAGQPSLRRLPSWAVHGFGVVVVFATAAIFFRRWRRRESDHVQERFAQKILRKWEWGDAPPSDDLRDIYLLHTERSKQREARLRAYKETVRELVADGLVSKGELVILDSLRAQLGVADKDHAKILAELSAEERQLFDPAYQGSIELRLKSQQYKKALERLVVEAAIAGATPAVSTLATLAADHGVGPDEAAAELAEMLGPDGPLSGLVADEIAAIERLAAAACAAHAGDEPGTESATLGFVAHAARWRGSERAARAVGILGAMTRRPEFAVAHDRIDAKPADAVAEVHRLRGAGPDELIAPLHAALTSLWHGAPTALTAAPLVAVVTDSSRYLRAAAVIVLSRFDEEPARAALIAAMDDDDVLVRQAAVRALGARARLTRSLLQRALADRDPKVRQAAVRAVAGTSSGEYPAADAAALAQTVRGVGNSGAYATLDANARVETLTDIERMMLLRQVPMFADLAPDDLDDIAAVVVEKHLLPGGDVCQEGDSGDAVYLLVKGKVRVFTGGGDRPERTLSELGPGACIGEMAVFDHAPRSATVRALERTRLLMVPGAEFKALLDERPAIASAIIAELVRRMRTLMAG
ncbi:MAG: cyclic nucleotide-binding domain-containing protein, partial [Kofleriaceae bacterium]